MMLPGISPLLLIISLSERVILGFQNGAPPSVCKSMAPSHDNLVSQSTSSPYKISARVINSDDGFVEVKIHSNITSQYFTGFLLKVKNTSPLDGLQVISGVFISKRDDVSMFLCNGDKMPAVTHSNSKSKYSVEVKWQAVPGYSGDVIFAATVLYNFTTFWTNVESLPINVSRKTAVGERVIEPKLSLNATLQKTYDGCGVTKNCLYTPEDCLFTQTCNSLLTILPSLGGVYQLEMFAVKAKFVGVGFSTDEVMGSDMNAECAYDGSAIKAYRSWNFPRKKVNVRLPYDTGVTLIRGIYNDRTIYCKIKVDAIMEAYNETVDLNNNRYYVILVAGQELSESKPGIGYHDLIRVTSKGRYFLPVISDPADEMFYDICDHKALCHGVPEGCLRYKNCRFVTKVNVQDHLFVVSMLAHRTLYVATGFTEDQHRGNDHIVECINNGSMLQTYRSWNVPRSFDNYRMGTTGLELFSGSVTSDILICTVMFDPSVIPSFKLDQPYYLILVSGSSLRQTQIGYHNLARSFSNATISLYRNGEANYVFYIGCGKTRRCFGSPDGCVSKKSCDIVVSIAPDNVGNRYSFHMKSIKSPAYIAVGLSDDKIMVNWLAS